MVEVDRLHFDLRSVLHWLADTFRKICLADLSTVWTALDLSFMLCHFYVDFWHIKHLSLFDPAGFHLFQRPLTVMTAAHAMHFFPVRMLNSFARMSCMTRLPSAFPSVAFTQTLGQWFVQPIT